MVGNSLSVLLSVQSYSMFDSLMGRYDDIHFNEAMMVTSFLYLRII